MCICLKVVFFFQSTELCYIFKENKTVCLYKYLYTSLVDIFSFLGKKERIFNFNLVPSSFSPVVCFSTFIINRKKKTFGNKVEGMRWRGKKKHVFIEWGWNDTDKTIAELKERTKLGRLGKLLSFWWSKFFFLSFIYVPHWKFSYFLIWYLFKANLLLTVDVLTMTNVVKLS